MSAPLIMGRYMVCDQIGAGGTATVHLGRILGASGFSRVVAIKRLDSTRADSEKFAAMLLDEARIASRIRHPNVNPTLDVVREDGELLLVMEYVHGPSLSWLRAALAERRATMPQPIALRVVVDALGGLHAAHNARSEQGQLLGLVHRDVSPQNVVVGDDGIARVLDFGVAKAEGRLVFSVAGEIKGKLAYMAPEQLRGATLDARTDVFAAGVVLAELLSGQPLFGRASADPMLDALAQRMAIASTLDARLAHVEPALAKCAARALAPRSDDRYASAEEMATALSAAAPVATHEEVATWLSDVAGDLLERRALQIAQIEQVSSFATSAPAPDAAATLAMTKTDVPVIQAPPAANATLKMTPAFRPDHTLPLPREPALPQPRATPTSALPLAAPARAKERVGGQAVYLPVAAVAIVLLVSALILAGRQSRTRDVGRVRAPDVVRPVGKTEPSRR